MESKDYNLVKQEVELVLSALNDNQVLSIQDEIEIEDHFFCDVEELCTKGLNTKEALLIARSRFGALDGIKEDYETVRPEKHWLHYIFVAIIGFSALKIILNVINMISESIWVAKAHLEFGEYYLYWDLPLRFMLFAFVVSRILNRINRKDSLEIKQFWFLPIAFLLSEVLQRWFSFTVVPGFFPSMDKYQYYGQIWLANAYFSLGLIVLSAVYVSYKLFKLKRAELQYV